MRRRTNPHLIPPREFLADVTIASGQIITATVRGMTVTDAENIANKPTCAGQPVTRIVVRSELPIR